MRVQYAREQMEIRTNGNLVFFLATFSRTNGNETVFYYFVATCSRTNGNLTQNACTKNENGIPFVRESTVQNYDVVLCHLIGCTNVLIRGIPLKNTPPRIRIPPKLGTGS